MSSKTSQGKGQAAQSFPTSTHTGGGHPLIDLDQAEAWRGRGENAGHLETIDRMIAQQMKGWGNPDSRLGGAIWNLALRHVATTCIKGGLDLSELRREMDEAKFSS